MVEPAGFDVLLVNSKDWNSTGRRSTAALYRNNHNGTFTDITRGSGLDIEIYGIGVAVGDYDNDGRDDVYITALDGDHLFHNEGNGKFTDVTKSSGISNASFVYQRRLSSNLRSRRQAGSILLPTTFSGRKRATYGVRSTALTKSYCTPESYKGTSEQALSQSREREV